MVVERILFFLRIEKLRLRHFAYLLTHGWLLVLRLRGYMGICMMADCMTKLFYRMLEDILPSFVMVCPSYNCPGSLSQKWLWNGFFSSSVLKLEAKILCFLTYPQMAVSKMLFIDCLVRELPKMLNEPCLFQARRGVPQIHWISLYTTV